MIIALGFWTVTIGYTLIYTGMQWFVNDGNGSLAESLGIMPSKTGTWKTGPNAGQSPTWSPNLPPNPFPASPNGPAPAPSYPVAP